MKLDPQERQALRERPGEPLWTHDDDSHEVYVVISQQRFDEMREVVSTPVDEQQLRQAIRNRRDESRRLNQDWSDADKGVWNQQDNH